MLKKALNDPKRWGWLLEPLDKDKNDLSVEEFMDIMNRSKQKHAYRSDLFQFDDLYMYEKKLLKKLDDSWHGSKMEYGDLDEKKDGGAADDDDDDEDGGAEDDDVVMSGAAGGKDKADDAGLDAKAGAAVGKAKVGVVLGGPKAGKKK